MQNLERLTRLNKSLLLLFKIENKLFHEKEEVNLYGLTKKIIDDFSDQLGYSRLAIEIIKEEDVTIHMNGDLAFILVTNLVKNAIVHNYPGGKIKIYLKDKSIAFENTGSKEPLDQQKLFARFNHKAGSETTSTGLGLAIVKAIADLYSFNLVYGYTGTHTFTLIFT